MFGRFAARFALVALCALGLAAPAEARFWQCVTFAREVSGIQIHGDALTWWGQAAGRYDRGQAPRVGAVLAIAPGGRSRLGHVAMVSRVVNDRQVLLTHANWSRRGGVERDVLAVDVSPAGDWSQVRVWYAPSGGLGTSTYRAHGFIYARGGAAAPSMLDRPAPVLASAQRPAFTIDLSAERALVDAETPNR